MSNAQHIFEWCRNSAEHDAKLQGVAKYPRHGNFSTAAAGMAFALSCEVYRAMKADREDYSPSDILNAALLMLEYERE